MIRKRVLFQSSGFRIFANFRRDGYDFDALWDDEKASIRQKKIMDFYLEENAEAEYFSSELKKKAGFGKGGEKALMDVNYGASDAELIFVSEYFASEKTKREKPTAGLSLFTVRRSISGDGIM